MANPSTKRRVEDVGILARLDEQKLNQVLKTVEAKEAFQISTEDFVERLSKIVEDDADVLGRFIVGVRRVLDDAKIESNEYFSDLLEYLRDEDLGEEVIDDWKRRAPILEKIVLSDTVHILAKSSELYYLSSNHIHSLRIVTDVRPVFSKDLKSTVAHIVKNNLFIQISDGMENEQMITVSLGTQEIQDLLDQAQRALTKTQTLVEEAKQGDRLIRVYDV